MEKYLVMGNPIEHSQSPFIHQFFSKQTGIEYGYGRLLVPLNEFDKTASRFLRMEDEVLMLQFLLKKKPFVL